MKAIRLHQQRDGHPLDVGEWKTPVASRHNADGSVSFITITPGMKGLEVVVGPAGARRTLIMRDGQHDYTFTRP
jgi:hypothetical protein